MEELTTLLWQLTNLIGDADFKLEMKAYRGAYQRLKIRLRNSSFTAKLKQLKTYTRQLEHNFSVELLQSYGKQINQSEGKKREHALERLQKLVYQLIEFLDKALNQTLYIYCHTQSHFKIGHLIHHFIMVRTTIARIRVCFKALLVYAVDLYVYIKKEDQVLKILIKHDCKPRAERPVSDKFKPPGNDEKIGQLIDRATFNKR